MHVTHPLPPQMDNNEALVSMCLAELRMPGGMGAGPTGMETVLLVGTARGLRYMPTDCEGEEEGEGEGGRPP